MAASFDIVAKLRADTKDFVTGLRNGEAATQSFSTRMTNLSKVVALGGVALVAVGGAALYKLGETFDEAYDNIRVSTGKTGEALEGLQGDMKAVAGAVPASFNDASTAISEFSKRLGLTGAPLQTLSSQVLELSRITDSDLKGNIDAVAKVMLNFGVGTEEQSGKLDLLFRASQASGVSVAELAGTMSGAGIVLRQVGLDFNQSAAFIATLAKAGVDASDVMPSLTKALKSAADSGKDAGTMFRETFDAIKNGSDPIAAATLSMEVFGSKGGAKFAAMIREGKLSFEEMTAAISGGGDTIMGASADTQDFAEKLTLLKNRVFLALEPIATKVFNKIGELMDTLGPKVEQLSAWMTENGDTVKIVAGVLGGVMVIALAAFTAGMIASAAATVAAGAPFIAIGLAIAALVAAIVFLWNNWDQVWSWIMDHKAYAAIIALLFGPILIPIFALVAAAKFLWANWQTIWNGIQTVVGVVVAVTIAYYKAIIAYIMFMWNNFQILWDVVKNVWSGILTAIDSAWVVIQVIWSAIQTAIGFLVSYWQFLWNVVSTVFGAIVGAVQSAWGFMSGVFDSIKNGIAGVAGFISEKVEAVVGFFLGIAGRIAGVGSAIASAIGDAFKGAWNFIAGIINNLIPDQVGFSVGPTIDLPDNPVPTFYNGGMVKDGLFSVGERGPELGMKQGSSLRIFSNPQSQKMLAGASVGGGSSSSVSYEINVNVAASADPASVGRSIVEAISAFERRSGSGWRS
jgi:MFS family permease